MTYYWRNLLTLTVSLDAPYSTKQEALESMPKDGNLWELVSITTPKL